MELSWNNLMEIPEARWIVVGTLLLFIVLLSVYIAIFFRNLAIGGADEESTEWLSGFRQMRDNGQLDDSEYSRLKQMLPENQIELTENNGEPVTETEKTEKKFLTLAEAQQLKQESAKLGKTDSGDQVEKSE